MANCLYAFCRNHPEQEVISDFIHSFENMMRKQTKESIEDFYLNVDILSSISDECLSKLMKCIYLSRYILDHVLIEDNKYCLDTTVTSLLCMVDHWYKKLKSKMNVITDDSKPIKRSLDIIKQLSEIDVKPQFVGYDTRKNIFPLPIASIAMVDSKINFGVQLADLIASSISFISGDTTFKYQKFQEELKMMSFFQLKGYSIKPVTTEFLEPIGDDSNDSSPIDFIIQNLQ